MAKKSKKPNSLDEIDLMRGLLAVLYNKNIRCIETNLLRWSYAFEKADESITPEFERLGLGKRYIIQRHQIHGDSGDVDKALQSVQMSGLLRHIPREGYLIRFAPDINELPGDPKLYEKFASEFLKRFKEYIPGRGM